MYAIQPKNPTNYIGFQGYRQADLGTINVSNKDTIDSYIKANKNILEPDYVHGEKAIIPFLLGTIKKTVNILSSDSIAKDARKVREGLDLIA